MGDAAENERQDEEPAEVVEGEVIEDASDGGVVPESTVGKDDTETPTAETQKLEEQALVLREEAPLATSLIPSAAEFTAMQEIAQRIASTQMVPVAYRGKPDDVIAAILTGREMGLGPMQSLRDIYVVDGKPSLAANLLLARMRTGGIVILESVSTAERAWLRAQRRDTGEITEVEWTYEEAAKILTKGKKLIEKDNWKNYPADMLWARAVGRLARRLGSDLIGSAMPYTSEEVQDWDDGGPRDAYPTHRSGGPATLKDAGERLAHHLGKDESVAWVSEVRDEVYQVDSLADLPVDGQRHAFSRLVAVIEDLDKEQGDVLFRTDLREFVSGLFVKHFDGLTHPEGPPWALGPSETDRPSKAEVLGTESGERGAFAGAAPPPETATPVKDPNDIPWPGDE